MSSTKKWACITGASSGIGKALAFEFAKNGFNLFLTARNESSLKEISEKCQHQFNIQAEILPADLDDENSIDNLVKAIANRKFDVLVNNAGFGVKGNFVETGIDEELRMLNVQLAAMLKLTKAVLPKMIEAKSGKILNVASVYSFAPVPKQSVYSASKAFILNFSLALQNELANANVQVSTVCPGITQTRFRTRAGIADKKDSGMTAEEVAKTSFAQMMNGKQVIIPGWQNKIFVLAAKHLPTEFFAAVMRFINDRRGINGKPE
jgi:short-subunit dehydrogenase